MSESRQGPQHRREKKRRGPQYRRATRPSRGRATIRKALEAGLRLDALPGDYRWEIPRSVRLVDGPAEEIPGVDWPGGKALVPDPQGWDPGRVQSVPRGVRDILTRFILLCRGTDSQIVDFVHSYGPLWLCEHCAPAGHDEECAGGWPGAEPITYYRHLSTLACAVVDLSASAAIGAPFPLKHLLAIRDFDKLYRADAPDASAGRWSNEGQFNGWWDLYLPSQLARQVAKLEHRALTTGPHGEEAKNLVVPFTPEITLLLAEIVNWWLRVGRVRPRLIVGPGQAQRPTLGLSGSAWGAIGQNLVSVLLSGGELGMAHCHGCNVSVPGRPIAGRRRWCRAEACQALRSRLDVRAHRSRTRQ